MDAFPPAGRAPAPHFQLLAPTFRATPVNASMAVPAQHSTAPIRPARSHKPDVDANLSIITEGLIGVLSSLIRIIGLEHWKVADSFSIRINYQR